MLKNWKLLIFGYFLNNYLTIKADINKFMIHSWTKSWISDEDFKIFIKTSYPYSRCCNIYIDGDDEGIDMLFHQFRKLYSFEYYVRHREYECQGYFLLSSSEDKLIKAMNKVPATISTTELLIIVNNYINNSSPLLNVKLFESSDVNVVAKSGKWSLSENFLYPRKFKKITRNEDLEHDSGIVDLQGRQLQIAAVHTPPHCYLYTAVKNIINDIEIELYTPQNALEYDGVEMKLFLVVAERLNFTWQIHKPRTQHRYGRPNGTTWNGGVIAEILSKKVDVAFGGVWLKHDFYRYVNLSQPWYQVFIHFLVPRPRPQASFWALGRPLSPIVWFLLFLMIITQSVNIYLRAWIDPQVPQRFKNYPMTLIELIGRLVGIWAPSKIKGLKIQLHLWHTTGLLLVTAYCSSLAARLTTPDYEKRIDTILQFMQTNLTWGRETTAPNFDDYFDLKDPYAGQFLPRFQLENSSEERHQKIVDGNYAIVGTIIESIFFPENDIRNEDLLNYRVMKQAVGDYYLSFVVQPWLLKSFDTVILWMRETGLAMYHLNNVIHRKTSLNLRGVLVEHDEETGEPKALIMTPLGAGFIMLLFGHFVALIMFCYEIKFGRKNKPQKVHILNESSVLISKSINNRKVRRKR